MYTSTSPEFSASICYLVSASLKQQNKTFAHQYANQYIMQQIPSLDSSFCSVKMNYPHLNHHMEICSNRALTINNVLKTTDGNICSRKIIEESHRNWSNTKYIATFIPTPGQLISFNETKENRSNLQNSSDTSATRMNQSFDSRRSLQFNSSLL